MTLGPVLRSVLGSVLRPALGEGVGVPPPPAGFVYLLGADGKYLLGADGKYLLGVA